MVKIDVRRDYYADLGLTPSADTDEIKKQFRKLGELQASHSFFFCQGQNWLTTKTLFLLASPEVSS